MLYWHTVLQYLINIFCFILLDAIYLSNSSSLYYNLASCEIFLHSTDFTRCLSGVCFREDIDFHVWAFLLRLAGHVASQLQETRTAPEFLGTVRTVFSRTTEHGHLWTQASIRCAWLNGLELLFRDHQFFSEGIMKNTTN